jgi:hypothetical protein
MGELPKIAVIKYHKKCWNCSKETPIVTYDIVWDYNYKIGDQPKLDEQLMNKYSFVKKRYSKSHDQEVVCNVCEHCDSIQGNYFIMEDLIEMAYINEKEKKDMIDSYIEDNTTDEEVFPDTADNKN